MPDKDLRKWIEEIDAVGELQTIVGADHEEEIGGIVDIFMRKITNPAVLFDEVPGYPKGFRVIGNVLTSVRRINVALGLPVDSSEIDLVNFWREHMAEMKSIPPTVVNGGSVLENVSHGDDVNIWKIPSPRWHEGDGGYYIGTASMVVMKDPDSDWINIGCYRVQAHDRNVASVMSSKGKHGNLIMDKYRERGEPCPVAVAIGVHPTLFMVGGMEMPYGKDEYEIAGGLMGEPLQVINGPTTGLPIPAHCEIAFEGLIHPDDLIDEGPLGEWAGYYASGVHREPAIRIETLMHRDDPILMGAVPGVPPNDNTFWRGPSRSGAVWNQLEAAGIPGVTGVWTHEAGGGRMWLTVSIKQMYGGHSKQAGLITSQCHAGAYANRWVIVVDDDINPANMSDVVWAMCTRFDPREDLEILKGGWSTSLDPMVYGADDRRNARVVIDACKPFARLDTFPEVVRNSPELDDRLRAKWADILPPGA